MKVKKKRGRPKMKNSEKIRAVVGYLNDNEAKLIVAKYGSLTAAVKEKILPELIAV